MVREREREREKEREWDRGVNTVNERETERGGKGRETMQGRQEGKESLTARRHAIYLYIYIYNTQ
jgi:hypothetical protein